MGELFDLRKFVTASVTVGPASGVLKDLPQQEWRPREVALTVLVDRCAGRLSEAVGFGACVCVCAAVCCDAILL